MVTIAQLLYTFPRWIELLMQSLSSVPRWIGRARGWLRKADEMLASASALVDDVRGVVIATT